MEINIFVTSFLPVTIPAPICSGVWLCRQLLKSAILCETLFNIALMILFFFIGSRFNDISVAIRTKCVQYSMHFLLNHPELRRDITETLKMRQHDSEENVRYEVVMAIVTTARRDFEVVSDSEDLLEFVKERTLDKKVNILS